LSSKFASLVDSAMALHRAKS